MSDTDVGYATVRPYRYQVTIEGWIPPTAILTFLRIDLSARVSSYEADMPCPVLAEAMSYASATPCPADSSCRRLLEKVSAKFKRDFPVKSASGLRSCYAMSGTELAYGTSGLHARYVMSGTDTAYAATRRMRSGRYCSTRCFPVCSAICLCTRCYLPTHTRCYAQYWPRCTVLPGEQEVEQLREEMGRGLRACYVMPGTDIAYGAVSLHACYAMPCTDIAHGVVCLGACYAMPDYVGEFAEQRSVPTAISLRARYAMSGTELAYGGTREHRPHIGEGSRGEGLGVRGRGFEQRGFRVEGPYAFARRCLVLRWRLWSYAPAMRYPVLTKAMQSKVLGPCYAISSSDVGTHVPGDCAMSSTDMGILVPGNYRASRSSPLSS
eukprot:3439565-Rhodomonas_salina.4